MDHKGVSEQDKCSRDEIGTLVQEIAQLKEEREQMKYEFKKKNDAFGAQEKFYSDEIEYWKSELAKMKKELKCQSNKFEDEIVRLKNVCLEESSDFVEKIHQLEFENKKLKKELQDIQNKTIQENTNFDKVHELEGIISDLNEKMFTSNVESKVLEQKCIELKEENMQLMKENEEYKLSLQLKREELNKSNSIIMELQDEISVLRKELHDLENQPRDINTKGNSLFAEIYDSRNKIRENFLILAAKYERTLKEKESLAGEVKILRTEVSTMRDIFENDMKNFKPGNLFELSGDSDSMSAMRSLVTSYKEEIERFTREEPPIGRDDRYYEAVIQRQKKDIDKLRGILSDHSLTHALKARKFSEMGCQLACWKSKVAELDSQKRFLNLKVQELENKILDLQEAPPTASEGNKENENKKQNSGSEKKDIVYVKRSAIKDNSKKTLEEIYGTKNIKITTKEEVQALLEKQTCFRKPDNKKEEKIQSSKTEANRNIGELNQDTADNKETTTSITDAITKKNQGTKKEAVRFADETKTEDGGRRRPRGKNSYVLDLQTNVLRKMN